MQARPARSCRAAPADQPSPPAGAPATACASVQVSLAPAHSPAKSLSSGRSLLTSSASAGPAFPGAALAALPAASSDAAAALRATRPPADLASTCPPALSVREAAASKAKADSSARRRRALPSVAGGTAGFAVAGAEAEAASLHAPTPAAHRRSRRSSAPLAPVSPPVVERTCAARGCWLASQLAAVAPRAEPVAVAPAKTTRFRAGSHGAAGTTDPGGAARPSGRADRGRPVARLSTSSAPSARQSEKPAGFARSPRGVGRAHREGLRGCPASSIPARRASAGCMFAASAATARAGPLPERCCARDREASSRTDIRPGPGRAFAAVRMGGQGEGCAPAPSRQVRLVRTCAGAALPL